MTQNAKMSAGDTILLVIALASKKTKITKFSEDTLYAIFHKLTEEFPSYFHGLYWHFLANDFPYCGKFEDILFRAAGCLLRTGVRMNEFLLENKTAEAIIEMMKKYHGEDTPNKLTAIADRFIELIPKRER